MLQLVRFLLAPVCAGIVLSQLSAQPPGEKPPQDAGKAKVKDARDADQRDGPRRPDGRGPGGPGGPGGPPMPGQILPPFLQDRLNLTAEQKKQLEALQKEVDGKLAKILTEDQKRQLKEMQQRGPGGRRPGDGPTGR